MKNTLKRSVALLILFSLLSALAGCGAPAGSEHANEPGETAGPDAGDAPDVAADDPDENGTDSKDGTENGAKEEIYDQLKEITAVADDIGPDEADRALMAFAGSLASSEYDYGDPLTDYYYRAVLERRPADERIALTLVRRLDPGLDSADSLYLDEGEEVRVGPSGMLKTEESGEVWESETALIFYRGKQVPCPLELDWCEVEYWEKELCYYDAAGRKTTQILPPRVHAGFAVTGTEDARIFIEATYAFPHSDEEETVRGYFDTETLVFTETERTQRITN